MSSLTDEKELLKRLGKGDVIAYEEIYRRYNKKIFIFSFKYLKNKGDAECIVQKVFLKLWENRGKFAANSNLNGWLFTVTFNSVRRVFRNLAIEKRHLTKYLESIVPPKNGISEIESQEMIDKAYTLIDNLPLRQKQVFLLQRDRGLSSSEIAEKLGITKKTVDNHLNRARKYLRKALDDKELP